MNALPYVRPDALPSHDMHPDTGCDLHPACLTCPFAVCRYELPNGVQMLRASARKAEVMRAWRAGEQPTDIASRLGVSARTVYRHIQGWPRD